MHTRIGDIITHIEQMNSGELAQIQEVIDRRRRMGDGPVSAVVERRDYRNGILHCEKRAYRRKDGGLAERGPYWYF